jgi:hypothetical protein
VVESSAAATRPEVPAGQPTQLPAPDAGW